MGALEVVAGLVGWPRPGAGRENFLSLYALLSLLSVLALWAGGLIVGFALVHLGLETPLSGAESEQRFGTYVLDVSALALAGVPGVRR